MEELCYKIFNKVLQVKFYNFPFIFKKIFQSTKKAGNSAS